MPFKLLTAVQCNIAVCSFVAIILEAILGVGAASAQLVNTPVITTTAARSGQVGKRYSSAFAARGGKSPRFWTVAGGSLPPGLTLNTQNGKVTGTPLSSGSFPVDMRVQDALGQEAIKAFTIAIEKPNLRGSYKGAASFVLTDCQNPLHNQVIDLSGTLKISHQQGHNLAGTVRLSGTVSGSRGNVQVALSSLTLLSDSEIAGSYSFAITGAGNSWTGSGKLNGYVRGKSFALNLSGEITSGEECTVQGFASDASERDFALFVSSSAVSAPKQSTSAGVEVRATPLNGLINAVNVVIDNIPAEVTVSPSRSLVLMPGTPQRFFFSPTTLAVPGVYPITLRATLGSVVRTATIELQITERLGPAPVRASYFSTHQPPRDVVYHSQTKRVFVSLPKLNRIDVISLEQNRRVESIYLPRPGDMDLSPDGTYLLVGTTDNRALGKGTELIHIVDPATLEITDRIPVTALHFVGPPRHTPLSIPESLVITSNGTVLLRMYELGSTAESLVQWDLKTGTLTERFDSAAAGVMTRSGDHTKVLISSSTSGGNLAVYDAVTDTFPFKREYFGNFIVGTAANHNGSQYAITLGCCSVIMLDGQLNEIGRINVGWSSGFVFSKDGRFLYVAESEADAPAFAVYDAQTFALLGKVPGIVEEYGIPVRMFAKPISVDETGLIFNAQVRGMSYVDASVPRALPQPAPLLFNPNAVTPHHGSLEAPEAIAVRGLYLESGASIYFGADAASEVGIDANGHLSAIAPIGRTPGPVNVTTVFPSGWFTIAPDAFTYGPHILSISPNAGSLEGGTIVEVLGYGFDFAPEEVQVVVGGRTATVVEVSHGFISSYPLPLHRIRFQAPPGSMGDADLIIRTPAGSITSARAFKYVKTAVKPASGLFAQIVYDDDRQMAFLTDFLNDAVNVWSLQADGFVNVLPTGHGPIGLAQTPDRSKLLITNYEDKTLTILPLENPAASITVSVIDPNDTTWDPRPVRVVATGAGKALIGITRTGVTGCVGKLRELDLATLMVTARDDHNITCLSDIILLAASPQGKNVIVGSADTSNGPVSIWNVQTNTFKNRDTGTFIDDVSVTDDASAFSVESAVFGESGELYMIPVSDLVFGQSQAAAQSTKLNATGSLLYGADIDSLKIFDRHRGTLRLKISLPEAVQTSIDSLAMNRSGTKLFLITASGLTIVELDSAPLGIGRLQPNHGPAAMPTSVIIHGSGFKPGIVVKLGDRIIASNFIDENRVQITVPATPSGASRITVRNSDGEEYFLDKAFLHVD